MIQIANPIYDEAFDRTLITNLDLAKAEGKQEGLVEGMEKGKAGGEQIGEERAK